MRDIPKIRPALLIAALVSLSGCGSQVQGQGQGQGTLADKSKAAAPDSSASTSAPPPKPLSADAAAPTGEPKKDDKDKRANTPPGTDRSGGGPASGAIVDPAGVTRK